MRRLKVTESQKLPTEIGWTAPQNVSDAIGSMGRTEDVRLSPSNKRLAVACLIRNRIAIFDINIVAAEAGPRVELTGCVELSSPALHAPHGVAFIDEETLIVANREGDVAIFKVPAGKSDARSCELLPIQTWPAGRTHLLKNPGSIAIAKLDRDLCEILICDGSGNTVTKHPLDLGAGYGGGSSEVLLRKWLDVPDGVSVSGDRQWIAVSNHNTHNVLLYESIPSLNEHSDPDGILRGVYFPHGLRFSSDGDHIFVADAGAPYVQVYARDGAGWWGVRHPVAKVRIMDQALFLGGRHSPEERGAKGIDIDLSSNVLVVTCELRPLAFFDVSAILRDSHGSRPHGAINNRMDDPTYRQSQRERCALEVNHELGMIEEHNLAKTKAGQNLSAHTQEPANGDFEISANYNVGDWIEFAADKGGDLYVGKGWSVAEPWGRWSSDPWGRWDEGSEAEIILHPSSDSSTHIEIETNAFVTKENPLQTVAIIVNGEEIKTLSFTPKTATQKHRIPLPSGLVRGKRRVIIRFKIANPRSPREVGHGTDDRRIGIGIVRLRLS